MGCKTRAQMVSLASFRTLSDGGVKLWIRNDTLTEAIATITMRLASFTEGAVWEEGQPVDSESGRLGANRHFFTTFDDLDRASGRPGAAIAAGPLR